MKDRIPLGPRQLHSHPTNGTFCFGNVPAAKLSHIVILGGPIHLPQGRHLGPHKGFGVAHIWAEHKSDIIDAGYPQMSDVPAYVGSLIYRGAPIHVPDERKMFSPRLKVVAGVRGVVILEERLDGQNNVFYSVVTAIPRGRPEGPRIGKVC